MTQAQKVIKTKVGLLELAKRLGNVSQACWVMAYSRGSFYRFRGRCCMIQLRREWGRFSNFSFRTPQRRISAYPARPSG